MSELSDQEKKVAFYLNFLDNKNYKKEEELNNVSKYLFLLSTNSAQRIKLINSCLEIIGIKVNNENELNFKYDSLFYSIGLVFHAFLMNNKVNKEDDEKGSYNSIDNSNYINELILGKTSYEKSIEVLYELLHFTYIFIITNKSLDNDKSNDNDSNNKIDRLLSSTIENINTLFNISIYFANIVFSKEETNTSVSMKKIKMEELNKKYEEEITKQNQILDRLNKKLIKLDAYFNNKNNLKILDIQNTTSNQSFYLLFSETETWNENKSKMKSLFEEVDRLKKTVQSKMVNDNLKPINNKDELVYREGIISDCVLIKDTIFEYANKVCLFFSLVEKVRQEQMESGI